jgi:hypothetical protein
VRVTSAVSVIEVVFLVYIVDPEHRVTCESPAVSGDLLKGNLFQLRIFGVEKIPLYQRGVGQLEGNGNLGVDRRFQGNPLGFQNPGEFLRPAQSSKASFPILVRLSDGDSISTRRRLIYRRHGDLYIDDTETPYRRHGDLYIDDTETPYRRHGDSISTTRRLIYRRHGDSISTCRRRRLRGGFGLGG